MFSTCGDESSAEVFVESGPMLETFAAGKHGLAAVVALVAKRPVSINLALHKGALLSIVRHTPGGPCQQPFADKLRVKCQVSSVL